MRQVLHRVKFPTEDPRLAEVGLQQASCRWIWRYGRQAHPWWLWGSNTPLPPLYNSSLERQALHPWGLPLLNSTPHQRMLINKSHIYSGNKQTFSLDLSLLSSFNIICIFVGLFLAMLGIWSRALHALSKCSVAELQPLSLLKFSFLLNAYFKWVQSTFNIVFLVFIMHLIQTILSPCNVSAGMYQLISEYRQFLQFISKDRVLLSEFSSRKHSFPFSRFVLIFFWKLNFLG